MNYNELKPEELRVLVAKQVMGLDVTIVETKEQLSEFVSFAYDTRTEEIKHLEIGDLIHQYPNLGWAFVPDYPEYIEAAWEVVEKLRSGRPFILICSSLGDQWAASFGAMSEAESAPHAICIAALKATEVQK